MVTESSVGRTTVDCYEFWDRVFRQAGVLDYTEGFYDGDPSIPYEEAQQRQINYLLDAVDCKPGSRILDIGCGNGTLLQEVRRRGAHGTGLTISPQQVQFCVEDGLDVRLQNYRDLPDEFNGLFDAVVANGPLEHFVQAEDAAAGRADAIYHQFFSVCHRALDPHSECRRLFNTTIHFDRFQADPSEAGRSPWSYRWLSDKFQFAMLVKTFGGYYPFMGQLERCARPYFRLTQQRDATQDYHLTSESWLRHGKRSLLSLKQWRRLMPFALRQPRHAAAMMFMLVSAQSWNWQFRGSPAPMKHLWQMWQYEPAMLKQRTEVPHAQRVGDFERSA